MKYKYDHVLSSHTVTGSLNAVWLMHIFVPQTGDCWPVIHNALEVMEMDGKVPDNVWLPSQLCIEFNFCYTSILQVLVILNTVGKQVEIMHHVLHR